MLGEKNCVLSFHFVLGGRHGFFCQPYILECRARKAHSNEFMNNCERGAGAKILYLQSRGENVEIGGDINY